MPYTMTLGPVATFGPAGTLEVDLDMTWNEPPGAGMGTLVAVCRTPLGVLELVSYAVATDGTLSPKGAVTAGPARSVRVACVGPGKFAVALVNGQGLLEVITYELGMDQSLHRLGTFVGESATFVDIRARGIGTFDVAFGPYSTKLGVTVGAAGALVPVEFTGVGVRGFGFGDPPLTAGLTNVDDTGNGGLAGLRLGGPENALLLQRLDGLPHLHLVSGASMQDSIVGYAANPKFDIHPAFAAGALAVERKSRFVTAYVDLSGQRLHVAAWQPDYAPSSIDPPATRKTDEALEGETIVAAALAAVRAETGAFACACMRTDGTVEVIVYEVDVEGKLSRQASLTAPSPSTAEVAACSTPTGIATACLDENQRIRVQLWVIEGTKFAFPPEPHALVPESKISASTK